MPAKYLTRGASADEFVGHASYVEALPLDALTSLTIEDAIKRTGFSRSRIYALIDEDRLRTFKVGKRRFIDAQSLRSLLAELMAPTEPPQGSHSARSGRDESSSTVRRQSRRVLEDADV
jgi:excisionase family DNA binding protein